MNKKYNLLVPMAGLGSRFRKQGYEVPKQFIYVKDKQLIDLSIDCVDTSECNLIFIVRDEQVYNYNVDRLLKAKFGDDIEIVTTEGLTRGSVCSCLLARDLIDNDLPLVIHTLDIEFFPQLNPASFVESGFDGNMLTFKSNSANYSYVETDDDNLEKIHIFGTPEEFVFYKDNVIKKIGEKPIALCSDHSGYDVKNRFKEVLDSMNVPYIDFGTHVDTDCDYKYYINQAVNSVEDGVCDFIFGFCRTGQGVNMCANKFKNVRGALIHDEYTAEMSRRHNCANFFSFPSRVYEDNDKIKSIVETLMNNTFDGGRHQIRIQSLEK